MATHGVVVCLCSSCCRVYLVRQVSHTTIADGSSRLVLSSLCMSSRLFHGRLCGSSQKRSLPRSHICLVPRDRRTDCAIPPNKSLCTRAESENLRHFLFATPALSFLCCRLGGHRVVVIGRLKRWKHKSLWGLYQQSTQHIMGNGERMVLFPPHE